jgi:predicted nucleic-acid-binding protein
MIAIDSNVLLRVLLGDDQAQAERAGRLLATECSPQRPGFVNRGVLFEAVWTLSTGYRYSRAQLASAIELLLSAPALMIEDREAVETALDVFTSTTRIDFADALVGVLNRRAGCATTYTSDPAPQRRRTSAQPNELAPGVVRTAGFRPTPEGSGSGASD